MCIKKHKILPIERISSSITTEQINLAPMTVPKAKCYSRGQRVEKVRAG